VEYWRGPVETFADERGELAVGSPAPGLLCTRASGRASHEMATFFVANARRVVERAGWIEGFHDWGGLVGYAPECRRILADWNVTQRAHIRRGHLYVTGLLVRMGVSVVSMGVDHLQVHHSRASLIAAYEHALRDAEPPRPQLG